MHKEGRGKEEEREGCGHGRKKGPRAWNDGAVSEEEASAACCDVLWGRDRGSLNLAGLFPRQWMTPEKDGRMDR